MRADHDMRTLFRMIKQELTKYKLIWWGTSKETSVVPQGTNLVLSKKKYQKQARVWYCKTKQKTDEVNKQMRKEEIEKMKDFAKEYGRSVTKEGEGKECC